MQHDVDLKLREVDLQSLTKFLRRVETGPRLIFFTRMSLKHRYSETDKLDAELTATAFEKVEGGQEEEEAGRGEGRREERVAAMVTMTPDRLRRLRRVGLFRAAFGLLVFVVALYLVVPVRPRQGGRRSACGEQEPRRRRRDWLGRAGVRAGGHVPRHPRAHAGPPTGKADALHDRVGEVLAVAVRGALVVVSVLALAAEALGGKIELDQSGRAGQEGRRSHIERQRARHRHARELPGVKETINLPLTGTLRAGRRTSRRRPGRYADANGSITLHVHGLRRWATARPRSRSRATPFLSGGLTLPRMRLGDLGGHVAIEKGTAKLQGVESKSPDGEVALEGEIDAARSAAVVDLNLYLRFKLSDAFLEKASALSR